ncbi:putative baseplate assembly protein [Geodermatophilus saharensis]|uniref:Putative baseplate assembly protein n=1 Tax=Geodermatophilus saharensis TaxID=1137994 RepID=A0A239C5G6_9ACTN|nr:putative baseplate assembly protein [Geodermatophilus saharensis]SNS15149.1 putative baseplate assembly protein [Geodermatophilus saharensis]
MTGPAPNPGGRLAYTSARGRIVPPDLDDRTWQDLVDQMHALIPRYAPAWTDHNPSDIGVALIELFAWLAEGVIYRLNRVPDRNYVAFLNLLGITRDPPNPAHTHLTFSATRTITVPAGTQAQTDAREGERPVVFETDEAVDVLPTNLVAAVLVTPASPQPRYDDVTTAVVGPPASTLTVTLPPNGIAQLCLGFDAPTTDTLRLRLRLFPPLLGPATPGGAAPVTVAWVSSRGTDQPLAWPAVPGATDDTAGLRQDGTVLLAPPADWAEQRATAPPSGGPPATTWTVTPNDPRAVVTRPLRWIGVRLTNTVATAQVVGVDRVLFNAALARTALTVRAPELLGESSGAPFQTFALANRPLHRGGNLDDPYGHLVVQVGPGDPAPWETWAAVDDLPSGSGRVYRLNPVTGEVTFGNFDERAGSGHGSIPPAGSQVRALTYRYVGAGAAGNVTADRVRVLSSIVTGVAAVTNPGPGRDGADEEPIEETMRRAPDQLKIRDRAVTAEDYEFLAREASNEVFASRCLTPRLQVVQGPNVPNPNGGAPVPAWRPGDPWTYAGIRRAPGNVTVVIVPRQDVARPDPGPDLLREVAAHLDRRRDLTAHLDVVGPRYLPVLVQVTVRIWPQARSAGVDPEKVKARIRERITAFLHPTQGGPAGQGWQVGQHVFSSDLFRAIMPPDDIGFIATLGIRPGVPLYHLPPLNPGGTPTNFNADLERPFPLSDFGATVQVADYELVCAPDPALHDVKHADAI